MAEFQVGERESISSSSTRTPEMRLVNYVPRNHVINHVLNYVSPQVSVPGLDYECVVWAQEAGHSGASDDAMISII